MQRQALSLEVSKLLGMGAIKSRYASSAVHHAHWQMQIEVGMAWLIKGSWAFGSPFSCLLVLLKEALPASRAACSAKCCAAM